MRSAEFFGTLARYSAVSIESIDSAHWRPGLTVVASIFVGSFMLPIVVLLITPGRKGKMRTTRRVRLVGMTAEQAWQLMADRMIFERFDVHRAGYPHRITASRPARHHENDSGTTIVTHATKALAVEGDLRPQADGVELTLTMWMNDFILLDSGEGRHIDQMLHRLIDADLNRDPPPLTPGTSMNALVGLAAAVLTIAGALLPLCRGIVRPQWLTSYGIGLVIGGIYASGMARQALRDIKARPEEVTGAGLSWFVLALSALGILGGAAWALHQGFPVIAR